MQSFFAGDTHFPHKSKFENIIFNNMKKKILLNGRLIEYDLQRKKVKNINLRVKRDMTITISASDRVSIETIETFMQKKADLILQALDKFSVIPQDSAETDIFDGALIPIFGEPIKLHITFGSKNTASFANDVITLTVKDPNSYEIKKRTLTTLLEKICREKVVELCRGAHPHFSDLCPALPEIRFRHMKSRWGSCMPKRGILTFNYALVHAPVECIEYVVFHEFTHFAHPDHSKNFYARLSLHVPDYKERKQRLEKTALL